MRRTSRLAAMMLEQDIGAPPMPPDEDDGDSEGDDEGWDNESLRRKFGNKILEWCKTSPSAKSIKRVIRDHVFGHRPKLRLTHVNWPASPYRSMTQSYGSAQVEWEWLVDAGDWNDLDDRIEAILKRSPDLARVFGVPVEQVWNVIDKGEVYEFIWRHIILSYTSNQYTGIGSSGRSEMQNDTGFAWYQLMETNGERYQEKVSRAILGRKMPREWQHYIKNEGGNPRVLFNPPDKRSLHLFGQLYGGSYWGKAILLWFFRIEIDKVTG